MIRPMAIAERQSGPISHTSAAMGGAVAGACSPPDPSSRARMSHNRLRAQLQAHEEQHHHHAELSEVL